MNEIVIKSLPVRSPKPERVGEVVCSNGEREHSNCESSVSEKAKAPRSENRLHDFENGKKEREKKSCLSHDADANGEKCQRVHAAPTDHPVC